MAYVTESFMAADRRRPAKGCWDRTAGQLIEELDACGGDVGKVMGDCDPEIGAWICFNPVDGTGRKDANVTSYRYALVECDNMEPGKQLAAIHQMELPCAALVYPAARASTPSSGSMRRIMLSTASGSITSTPPARRTV